MEKESELIWEIKNEKGQVVFTGNKTDVRREAKKNFFIRRIQGRFMYRSFDRASISKETQKPNWKNMDDAFYADAGISRDQILRHDKATYRIALVILVAVGLALLVILIPKNKAEPVHDQARKGDILAVKKYITDGGDVNAKQNYTKGNILSYAVTSDNVELVRYLISQGADVNDLDRNGATPLHYASRFCQLENVKLLLQSGANPNIMAPQYKRSYTEEQESFPYESGPLHWAICASTRDISKKVAIIKALLDAGASPNSYHEENTLDPAVKRKDYTPLELAVIYADTTIVGMLIEKGADVNLGAPLHYAAALDRYEAAQILIKSGCGVSTAIRFGASSLISQFPGGSLVVGNRSLTPMDVAKTERIRDLLKKAGMAP